MAFDQQGNATWEWQSKSGTFMCDIDTQQLKTMGAELHCEDDAVPDGTPPHDPYNRAALPESGQSRPKRRTLDDLRRLSEEIKAGHEKKDRES